MRSTCESSRFAWSCLLAVLLIAAVSRAPDVWRPIDGTVWETWREPDVGGIARNFYREGMNILYPRIDWRGDGPGYVESEFPLYAWTVAAAYRLMGYHEELARALTFMLSLLSCVFFFRLCKRVLPPIGMVSALAVFACNPLAVKLGSAIQPEPLMFTAYLAAIDYYLQWLDSGRRRVFYLSMLATGLSILAKLPAIHIGLLLAALSLDRWGVRALRRGDLWLFALGALIPPALWYWHAHGLWLAYGNSLGMSNEAYLRIHSLHFLRALPSTFPGIVKIEIRHIWTLPGVIVGAVGLLCARGRAWRLVLYWMLSLLLFYVVTGRTTGESWARYYHIVSLPPVALLIGLTMSTLLPRDATGGRRSGVCALLDGRWWPGSRRLAQALGVLAYAAILLLNLRDIRDLEHPSSNFDRYACAQLLGSRIPADALIVVSGGAAEDQYGLPAAFNKPYMFYWMDRKGFSLSDRQHTVPMLESLAQRGATYFVIERPMLEAKPTLADSLDVRYGLVAECKTARLYDIGRTR